MFRQWTGAARAAFSSIALVTAFALPATAVGQAWPAKPIRMVVPYAPGGSTDLVARMVSQKLAEALGQPVVVDNRPGSSGNIGTDIVAKAAPDGYTLSIGNDATHSTNIHLNKSTPFDPLRDFTPLAYAVANIITVSVHPSVPVQSVRELVDFAKKNPGKLSFGSSGTGSPHHLAGELMKQLAGIDMTHVPYKGSGPMTTDLLNGNLPVAFVSLVSVVPHIRAGKVRTLAVVEGQRYPGMPDVPTVGETLPGFELVSWLGFFGPAGLPAPIVQRLSTEMNRALEAPDVKAKLDPQGLLVSTMSPERFGALIKADLERRGRIIATAGIKPE
jgi:tripartite-type tricarboxylate transporter receptor subunit TctC